MSSVGVSVGGVVGGEALRERLRRDVDLIVGRLHGKRVLIDDTIEVDFVDREREARTILEGVARIRASKGVVVLYGPKGCGKSRFFDVLTEAIKEANEGGGTNIDVIYVKWDDAEKAVKAVGSGLLESIKDEILSRGVEITFDGGVAVSSNLDLLRFSARMIDIVKTSRKAREHGRILFIIDERSVKTRGDAEEFRSELDSLADNMSRAILKYYQEKKGYMTAAVLSSDALVAEAWQRIGTKVGWLLMWNLPRRDFERLADQLGINVDRDLLWSLTGGNPRALGDIAEADLHTWLGSVIEKVKQSIRSYVADLAKHRFTGSQIWEHISGSAKEPLGFIAYPLAERFLEDNIAIKILGIPVSELPSMPTIGRMNAYQIPAYYYTLRAIAKRDASMLLKIEEVEITPEEVIEEARRISGTEKQ